MASLTKSEISHKQIVARVIQIDERNLPLKEIKEKLNILKSDEDLVEYFKITLGFILTDDDTEVVNCEENLKILQTYEPRRPRNLLQYKASILGYLERDGDLSLDHLWKKGPPTIVPFSREAFTHHLEVELGFTLSEDKTILLYEENR